jgi:hypothetical protein
LEKVKDFLENFWESMGGSEMERAVTLQKNFKNEKFWD